jgi:hypothetical protein
MKTRIIHTRFWQDNFVCQLSHKEKLLFVYLITNEKLGLTGIYELPDKYIKVDLELNQTELNIAKSKFQKARKFYFDNGWIVVINVNKYNNYTSSPKVKKAYNKELENIPEKLKSFALSVESEDYKQEYVKSNSTYKHIIVAETFLGRKLTDSEIVHHIDENPSNNEPSNLAVMSKDKHIALHKGDIKLEDTSMILVSDYSDTPNNHKSKIINNNNNKTYKVKIDNGEKEFTLEEIAKRLLNLFNEVNKTKYSNIKVFISNLEKTLEIYTPLDIAKAIEHIPLGFWKDKMKPEILFRQKNPQGEPVDYIGQLLNSKQKYE